MKIIKTAKYKKIAYNFRDSSEDIVELIMKVAEGNMGGAAICKQLWDRGEVELIEKLLEKGITGSNIWIKYKDEHGENIDSFIKELRAM